jgi:hypothetical protein
LEAWGEVVVCAGKGVCSQDVFLLLDLLGNMRARCRFPAGYSGAMYILPKDGIGHLVPGLIAQDCLQDHSSVMRALLRARIDAFRLPAFQPCDFGHTTAVTLGAAEPRLEKYFDQLPGDCIRDHAATQADDVHVVVLNPLVRRKALMDQACAHTRHLVGGNARANPTPADSDPSIHLAVGNCPRQGHDKIRIVGLSWVSPKSITS